MLKTKNKYLYEHLSLIVKAYEEELGKMTSRDAILVMAHSPLAASRELLHGSLEAMQMNYKRRKSSSKKSNNSKLSSSSKGPNFEISVKENTPEKNTGYLPQVPVIPSVIIDPTGLSENTEMNMVGQDSWIDLSRVEFDDDMKNLTGVDDLNSYLSECFNCDLRVKFDWQLKPIDLVLPIVDFLDQINDALDQLESQLNPFKSLEELCNILNGINWLCLPDLISLLMALKMLFMKYMTFQLKLNLDWTVLLGPLLKFILDALASLIQAIAGVLLGPIECVLGVLRTISQFEQALVNTGNAAVAFEQRFAERIRQGKSLLSKDPTVLDEETTFDLQKIMKQVSVKDGTGGTNSTKRVIIDGTDIEVVDLEAPRPPSLSVKSSSEDLGADVAVDPFAFLSGISLNDTVTLPEALKDPRFHTSHWTIKMIMAVEEAKQYIIDLVSRIVGSLNSIKGLVAGSLSLQIGNLGLLLFIKDMISLVLLVYALIKQGQGITDWCEELEKNPEILEKVFPNAKAFYSENERAVVLQQGEEILGKVYTCSSQRVSPQNNMITSWISELKEGRQ